MITVDTDAFAESMVRRMRQHPDVLGSVTYAATYRCNLACVHCYALGADAGAPRELTVEEAARLFDQFAELGCLHCTLTGGDPLVRDDFESLWTMIAERGIRRVLFTNAVLVDARKAALLRTVPPDWVEVSIYGADAARHDAVTRVPGSFEATFAGIRLLEDAGVRVRLKTVLMVPTVDQIGAIKALARSVGDGSFRMDGQLMGAFAGGVDVEALRVAPEQLVAIEQEFGDATMERMCHEVERLRGVSRTLQYGCGAARHSAYLSPWGDLHPCLTAAHVHRSVREMPVRAALDELRREIHGRELPEGHPCRCCDAFMFCQSCPASAALDTGDPEGRSPYPGQTHLKSRRGVWRGTWGSMQPSDVCFGRRASDATCWL